MLTKNDLEKLANVRLEDSRLLLEAGRSSSAYYLAGYAVELALKACISKLIQPNVIPEKAFVNAIYTHKLDNLLSIAGLLPQFNADTKADTEFAAYWAITSKWTEESRYEFWDPMSATTLLTAIQESNHGVFQWVKKHW
jgi:HEPN domain-containing protein